MHIPGYRESVDGVILLKIKSSFNSDEGHPERIVMKDYDGRMIRMINHEGMSANSSCVHFLYADEAPAQQWTAKILKNVLY